ncbi:hypothetical protein [Streptomyces sp. NBC_00470]|uniref:hypothetical protein n=1 Tax=Streptomyces sp. NBC_00470 TaxID=2975753 RepID=UPI0030E1A676
MQPPQCAERVPHGPDAPCTCDGCWACRGHVIGCTCDIDWDCVYSTCGHKEE